MMMLISRLVPRISPSHTSFAIRKCGAHSLTNQGGESDASSSSSSSSSHNNNHDSLDPETISLIKSYPVHTDPTPYELLNVSYHSFDEKTLKSNFNKFAKIYHPDIKISHPLLVNRTDKFQKILSAYKLLKDPHKKTMYDQYKLGWDGGLKSTYNLFKLSPNYKEYQYYSAATWEDFQHMKNGAPKKTWDAEKNKYQILASIVLFLIVVALVEYLAAKEISEQDSIRRSHLTQRSKIDLQKLYNNYGMGLDKDSRIHRFLWWRHISEILFNHS